MSPGDLLTGPWRGMHDGKPHKCLKVHGSFDGGFWVSFEGIDDSGVGGTGWSYGRDLFDEVPAPGK